MRLLARILVLVVIQIHLSACPSGDRVLTAGQSGKTTAEQSIHQYTVKKVLDGDSFVATRNDDKDVEIRLFGIDAPERQQPYASIAQTAAAELLEGQSIQIVITDTDRYQRLVAWVYVEGQETSVNAQHTEQGMVWVYHRYTSDKELIEKEKIAKSAGRGLWSLPAAQRIPPWEWRQRARD